MVLWDESNGCAYFHNETSQTTQYENPWLAATLKCNRQTRADWSVLWDEANACPYYYNATTLVNQYENPWTGDEATEWAVLWDEANGVRLLLQRGGTDHSVRESVDHRDLKGCQGLDGPVGRGECLPLLL